MSESRPVNLHGTAVVIGTRGILFTGPSGSGKSAMAFLCMTEARRQGAYAALVADDQVFVSRLENSLIAERPASIAGLMEIRGSGIVTVESAEKAVIDLVVRMVSVPSDDRLPPNDERFSIADLGDLPMIRLRGDTAAPLAAIAALFPEFRGELPF